MNPSHSATPKVKYSLSLDHAMGYNGSIPKSTIMHPNLKNYLYIAGSVIVIAEMNDANAQEFLRGHDDEVTCIALSNSGGLLASGQKGKNSDVFIWNFEARKVLFRLSEHDYLIQNLQFSQDDRLLYSSGNIDDKKMYIWDTQTGYIVANCPTYPTLTSAVAWGNRVKDNKGQSTENYQLATCGGLIVSLWSLDPFKGVLSSQAIQTGNFTREYISLAFSLNEEKFLYAGTTSGDIVCFLVKTKMIVFSKIVCSRGVTSIIPIAVNQFVVGGGDGSMSLLYIEEPKCEILTTISLFGSIYSLSPSPDGIQLLASTDKGFIYRVRTADLSYILLNENHTDGIISYFNPAELQGSFGTASLDRTIRLWDLEDYSSYYRLFLNLDLIPTCLEFTDDVLFSGWSDGKLRTFEIKNSKLLWSIDNVHKNGVTALTVAKNKKFICTGGEGGEIRVWEIKSHEMVSNLKEHKSKVTKIHLLSNDVHLITSAKDRSILIWDLPKEQRIATYTMAVGGVNSFKVNPLDENMMISVGQDRKITQWDIRQPKPVRSISSNPYNRPDEADELLTVDISNDGRYFATGGASGIIRSYDLPSMNFLTEVAAHSGNCTNVAFSKNDRYLITCGSDSQILTYTINYS